MENNLNTQEPSKEEKGGSFTHFMVLFFGFILFMVGISYAVKWMFE